MVCVSVCLSWKLLIITYSCCLFDKLLRLFNMYPYLILQISIYKSNFADNEIWHWQILIVLFLLFILQVLHFSQSNWPPHRVTLRRQSCGAHEERPVSTHMMLCIDFLTHSLLTHNCIASFFGRKREKERKKMYVSTRLKESSFYLLCAIH
jgi:hypothetical protein